MDGGSSRARLHGILLTNSPGRGRDFMSEIGLVQAAVKQVDKISKVMLNFIVPTETFIFSDLTH